MWVKERRTAIWEHWQMSNVCGREELSEKKQQITSLEIGVTTVGSDANGKVN